MWAILKNPFYTRFLHRPPFFTQIRALSSPDVECNPKQWFLQASSKNAELTTALEKALECKMLKNAEAERLMETNKKLKKTSEELAETNKELTETKKNLTEKNTELSEKLEQLEAVIQQHEVKDRPNIKTLIKSFS